MTSVGPVVCSALIQVVKRAAQPRSPYQTWTFSSKSLKALLTLRLQQRLTPSSSAAICYRSSRIDLSKPTIWKRMLFRISTPKHVRLWRFRWQNCYLQDNSQSSISSTSWLIMRSRPLTTWLKFFSAAARCTMLRLNWPKSFIWSRNAWGRWWPWRKSSKSEAQTQSSSAIFIES